MMKKVIISCVLLVAPLAVFAQLKVNRNGDVTVGKVTSDKMSKLSVSGTITTDGVVVPVKMETERDLASDKASQETLSSIMSIDVVPYVISTDTLESENQDTRYALSPKALMMLYPSLVSQSADGTQGINYTGLIPLLVRSIQELKQEIDSMKLSMVAPNTRQTRSLDSSFGTENRFNAVLMQNKPNPVKDQATIEYCLAGDFADASLHIYDMSGKTVKSFNLTHGTNNITISASELPAGLYIYSLVVDDNVTDTKKMIILK